MLVELVLRLFRNHFPSRVEESRSPHGICIHTHGVVTGLKSVEISSERIDLKE